MTRGPDPTELSELPGLDPAWSRFVDVVDPEETERRWHLLDNGVEPTAGTLLCVHGNPTWSYLWRRFVVAAPPGWRVVAVDQLGMGLSERPREPRDLALRIADLATLTDAVGIDGPVVLAAHDWGGLVALGWALEHREQVVGLVLTNTAVFQPLDQPFSGLIRAARSGPLHETACVRTPAFVRGAVALSRPALAADVRTALAWPYRTAARRQAIGDFVADVPLEADHPSRATMEAVAEGVRGLRDVPTLVLWGGRDPVFTQRHLDDLVDRLPQADVHRFARASHLVTEDVPETAEIAWSWIGSHVGHGARTPDEPRAGLSTEPLWSALSARAGDPEPAVVTLADGEVSTTTFAELERHIADLAVGLADHGIRPGQRVALLVPPGADLTAAVFACWRVGAVIVIADAGLGLRGMGHALRSARPDHVIGIGMAIGALNLLGVPGRRIVATALPKVGARVIGRPTSLPELTERGARLRAQGVAVPAVDGGHDDRAVLFTSGATGPAKGVVYRGPQLRAQVDALAATYDLRPEDRWVAAFAPFALYGPALGTGAAVPDMDVTAPATLTAAALGDAAAAVDARVIFASPAALRNVVATADGLTPAHRTALGRIRLVMSAGAPVPASLLRQVQGLVPAAALHTPYGMTEVLPVADISLAQIEAAGPGDGVCVGRPIAGVEVLLSPLDALGRADGDLVATPGVTGEIVIAAPHRKDRYDRLWATEQASTRNPGRHRSGDVGHFDDEGRLWVEGRLVHVVTTPDGPVTPVGVEQRVEALAGVRAAAVAGVGPTGTQQVVVVVVPDETATRRRRRPLADAGLSAAVREVAGVPVAAVLVADRLPTDIRHNSKVDRAAVATWAGHVLAGERAGRL